MDNILLFNFGLSIVENRAGESMGVPAWMAFEAALAPRMSRADHNFDCARRAARAIAAHRCSNLLANRCNVSHNRDEIQNSVQRWRGSDAAPLSISKMVDVDLTPLRGAAKKPSRQLARFEADFFGAARKAIF